MFLLFFCCMRWQNSQKAPFWMQQVLMADIRQVVNGTRAGVSHLYKDYKLVECSSSSWLQYFLESSRVDKTVHVRITFVQLQNVMQYNIWFVCCSTSSHWLLHLSAFITNPILIIWVYNYSESSQVQVKMLCTVDSQSNVVVLLWKWSSILFFYA